MDKATFWATKSPLAEFHAITFAHPAFSQAFRLVANQFAPVTLGGQVYQPAPMQIKPPDSKSDAQPKLTMVFPRQVVGRQFKQELKRVTDSGSREPIAVTYSVYLGDTSAPQIEWNLYASESSGVSFGADGVQVTATEDNIMRRAVAPIYTPDVFTGLELIR